jgi:hypothetical protein
MGVATLRPDSAAVGSHSMPQATCLTPPPAQGFAPVTFRDGH